MLKKPGGPSQEFSRFKMPVELIVTLPKRLITQGFCQVGIFHSLGGKLLDGF